MQDKFFMSFFAVCLSAIFISFTMQTEEVFRSISEPFHNLCLSFWSNSQHADVNMALFCGQNIQNKSDYNLYVKGGVIHILVVSGSHLFFLKKIFKKIPILNSSVISNALLFLYCLATSWQAPTVRAFVQSLCPQNKNPVQNCLHSLLICLSLHPQWVFSKSLTLSFVASLCLQLTLDNKNKSFLLEGIIFYLFLSPLIYIWSETSPALILLASLLAPVLLLIWFLIGCTEAFWPSGFWLLNQFEFILNWTLLELGQFTQLKRATANQIEFFQNQLWSIFYALFAFVLIWLVRVIKNRRALWGNHSA